MTLGAPRPGRMDALIAPGTALFFSIFVGFLAPHYPIWFGDALPALTRGFLAAYPIWIALTVGALLLQVWLKVLQPQGTARALWVGFDRVLSVASLLVIAVGVIALALPVMRGPGQI